MDNSYEGPEALKLGKAREVILGQKVPDIYIDSLGVPFSSMDPVLDESDE